MRRGGLVGLILARLSLKYDRLLYSQGDIAAGVLGLVSLQSHTIAVSWLVVKLKRWCCRSHGVYSGEEGGERGACSSRKLIEN